MPNRGWYSFRILSLLQDWRINCHELQWPSVANNSNQKVIKKYAKKYIRMCDLQSEDFIIHEGNIKQCIKMDAPKNKALLQQEFKNYYAALLFTSNMIIKLKSF